MLTESRRFQLKCAHEALDRGDKETAASWLFRDIDGMMGRIIAVIERKEGPTVQPTVDPAEYERRAESRLRRAQCIEHLQKNPKAKSDAVAEIFGYASGESVRRIRRDIGLSRSTRVSIKSRYLQLIADKPGISDEDASMLLGCTPKSVAENRRQVAREQEASGRAPAAPEGFPATSHQKETKRQPAV